MIRATIIFLLFVLWNSVSVSAQALERFRPLANKAGQSIAELRTRSTVNDLFVHTRGIYTCTERGGCFLLPADQVEAALPIVAAQDRRDRFGPIILIAGTPHVIINGYQAQSLLTPTAPRWDLTPAQFPSTVRPGNHYPGPGTLWPSAPAG